MGRAGSGGEVGVHLSGLLTVGRVVERWGGGRYGLLFVILLGN